MKKVYFFFLHFEIVFPLILFSCGESDDPILNQDESVFRISYIQQGDLEGFTKMFTYDTNLASSEDFIWFDSRKPAPAYLDTDSLTGNNYMIATKKPVKEISLNVTLGWIPTRAWEDGWQGPDEMAVELSVWRNDALIDTEKVRLSSEDKPSSANFQKSYAAQP